MDTQLRLTYDVLYYVHRKDCGGRGNMAIISEQSSRISGLQLRGNLPCMPPACR